MREHKRLISVVLASMSGLLLGGQVALLPGLGAAGATVPESVTTTVSAPQEVAVGLRRPGHPGVKARKSWFVMGGHVIAVDVNPTLPGRASYKVVLKVQYKGEWVRCGSMRTVDAMVNEYVPELAWFTRGRRPHEVAIFSWLYGPEALSATGITCPGKPRAPDKYRVVIPAQHGFERTVSRVLGAQM